MELKEFQELPRGTILCWGKNMVEVKVNKNCTRVLAHTNLMHFQYCTSGDDTWDLWNYKEDKWQLGDVSIAPKRIQKLYEATE